MMAEWKIDITKAVKDTAERAMDEYQYNGMTIREWADKITSGEYQPVKHGRWFHDSEGYARCSVCNEHEINGFAIFCTYCPNCGAIMDGGEDE